MRSLFGLFWRAGGAVAFVPLAAFLIWVPFGLISLAKAHAVDTSWVPVLATVEKVTTFDAKGGPSDRVDLAYRMPDGKVARGSQWGEPGALAVGDQLPIRAAPDFPHEPLIGPNRFWGEAWLVGQMVLSLSLVSLAHGLWVLRRARQVWHLRRTGRRETVPIQTVRRGRSGYRLTWTDGQGRSGATVTGLSDWRGRFPMQPGDPITIYADPRGKLPGVWEGDT